ncbi:hypothetical protein V4836_08160 [Kluyvera ascorbata]|uniref:Uncharacterized protein n=1 Tax=Kluyvera ascorbata TaxID=51288 RepID=A0AB35X5S2_9ENTR
MAGKPQTFQNEFPYIAGNFDRYSKLTKEGKDIVNAVITKCAGKKGYPVSKVYYLLFNCSKVTKVSIKEWLDRYYVLHSNDSVPTDSNVRKFYTIIKQLSVAMMEAYNSGVKLFKTTEPGLTYLTPLQKYEMDQMYTNGKSAQEMIEALQALIDSAK